MCGLTWENCVYGAGQGTGIGQGFQDPRDILGTGCERDPCTGCWPITGTRCSRDGYFADLYSGSVKGQPTVPARVVATVMVLQAFEGLSGPGGLRPAGS